jgi:predicted ribosome quality control (RQC) complex YloA/Tae2 family protein
MPRRFASPSGFEVLVGLDARENEKLSLQVAAGHDYWFHAWDKPGSHVIMRVPKNQRVPVEDIEWAAGVAAWYSKSRGPGKVRVTVALGADIAKPGFPCALGTVDCASFKNISVKCILPHINSSDPYKVYGAPC